MMLLLLSITLFFQEEEQVLKLCFDENAAISEFTALMNKGVRVNIHDKEFGTLNN